MWSNHILVSQIWHFRILLTQLHPSSSYFHASIYFFLAKRGFILFLETSLFFGLKSWLSGLEPFQATGYWRQKEPGGSEKAHRGQVNALGQWGHPHQVSHCSVRDFLRQTQQTALECTVMSNSVFSFLCTCLFLPTIVLGVKTFYAYILKQWLLKNISSPENARSLMYEWSKCDIYKTLGWKGL